MAAVALHSRKAARPRSRGEVLTAAELLTTIVRFVLLLGWALRTRRAAPDPPRGQALTAHASTEADTRLETAE